MHCRYLHDHDALHSGNTHHQASILIIRKFVRHHYHLQPASHVPDPPAGWLYLVARQESFRTIPRRIVILVTVTMAPFAMDRIRTTGHNRFQKVHKMCIKLCFVLLLGLTVQDSQRGPVRQFLHISTLL